MVKLISHCPYKDEPEGFSTVVVHLVLKALGIAADTQIWFTTARKVCQRKANDKVTASGTQPTPLSV